MYSGLSYSLCKFPTNMEVKILLVPCDWTYIEDNLLEEEVKIQSHVTISMLKYTWYIDMNLGDLNLGQYFFCTRMFVMANRMHSRNMWILVSRWVTYDVLQPIVGPLKPLTLFHFNLCIPSDNGVVYICMWMRNSDTRTTEIWTIRVECEIWFQQ